MPLGFRLYLLAASSMQRAAVFLYLLEACSVQREAVFLYSLSALGFGL
jgi:hypothetical protein